MTFDDLAEVIKKMSKKQRTTEVCVFEEGTNRYIWPAKLTEGSSPDRPYLEGVAETGEGERTEIKPNPTGLDAAGNRPKRTKPTGLDASLPQKGRKKD